MSAAHDTRIEVDGDTYFVRRDFDLIRRIEQASGPLAEIDGKLRSFSLSADAVCTLYKTALQAQRSRPDDDVIRDHIAEVGVREASQQIAILIMHLFAGNRRTIEWLKAEAERGGGGGEDEDEHGDPLNAA